jgi:hypothetical protein
MPLPEMCRVDAGTSSHFCFFVRWMMQGDGIVCFLLLPSFRFGLSCKKRAVEQAPFFERKVGGMSGPVFVLC